MLIITKQVENFSRKNWLSRGCEDLLSQNLADISVKNASNQALQQTLITFILQPSDCCRKGEYLPNSSEVLESLFGKQKYLEGEHANRGFSGLVLSIGAMISDLSATVIKKAMETVPVKQIIKWQREFPSRTLQARQVAINFATPAEQKPT